MSSFEIYRGDCLELMQDLPSNSVDLILCDLPYGTTICAWDSIIPFEDLWRQYERIAKISANIVLTASQPFTTKLIHSNMADFRYTWVWDKRRPSNPMHAKNRCLKIHEDIIVFYKKKGVYNPQGVFETDGKPRGGTAPSKTKLGFGARENTKYVQKHSGYPKSIISFGSDNTKNVHPTQKPVALMEYLIKTYTNAGDTVLDNCMGSGTTGVACANTDRNFIGMEKEREYYHIARKRIAEAYKIKAP